MVQCNPGSDTAACPRLDLRAAPDAAVGGQATAVLRERGLGAVERGQRVRDFTADVTTAQQKALSGVAISGGVSSNSQGRTSGHAARPDRGNSLLLRQKHQGQVASNGGEAGDAEDDFSEDTSGAGQAFNSRAQFADFDAGSATAAGVAAAGSAGSRVGEAAGAGTTADQSLGSHTLGAQRAAAKFKLPTEKVRLTRLGLHKVSSDEM